MLKSLWAMIGMKTNRYRLQKVDRRVQRIISRFVHRPRETREIVGQIHRRLSESSAYQTHAIPRVIGLLVARVMDPRMRRFSAHWAIPLDGAVPAVTFGRFMGRIGEPILSVTFTLWSTKLSARATSTGNCAPLSIKYSSDFGMTGTYLQFFLWMEASCHLSQSGIIPVCLCKICPPIRIKNVHVCNSKIALCHR